MTPALQTHKNANNDPRGKTNIDIIRRIMSEKKNTLPSLKNQDWKTVKFKTDKENDLVTNIQTNGITELNDLIYAGAKLVWKTKGAPWKPEVKFKTRVGTYT